MASTNENSISKDCPSKMLKTSEDYVSEKLQRAYKQTATELFGIRIPSHVLRTSVFLSVVVFTLITRFYLIHQPKHIW